MAKVQCQLAAQHGGKCADALHVFNGPEGKGSAQRYLNPLDATHLTQRGHDTVADVIVKTGFDPLVASTDSPGTSPHTDHPAAGGTPAW
jgi:hypothetical protein